MRRRAMIEDEDPDEEVESGEESNDSASGR